MSTYWLYSWIDQYDVKTLRGAQKLLASKKVMEDLKERVERIDDRVTNISPTESHILAGRGLDFHPELSCSNSPCRQKQVDKLFRHVWHYFDHIVVDDEPPRYITKNWDKIENKTRPLQLLLSHIDVLLYLRKIGAEGLVEFREKPAACTEHWERHAEEAGLTRAIKSVKTLIKTYIEKGTFKLEIKPDGSVVIKTVPPGESFGKQIVMPKDKFENQTFAQIKENIATDIVKLNLAYLTTDVQMARKLGAPLGVSLKLHDQMLQQNKPSVAEIAFALELPILNSIPVKDLIKIRRDEYDHFKRFQDRLRLAIQERIKITQSETVTGLAKQIQKDLIEPELRNIGRRLKAAEKSLSKKTGASIFLGTLTTSCGLLTGLGPALAVGAGITVLAGTAGRAAMKHIDERSAVSLEDMYFLWKATQHAPH